VPPSHDRDELVLQQWRAPKPFAHAVERPDRNVEIAAVEEIEDVEGSARPQIELQERRGREHG